MTTDDGRARVLALLPAVAQRSIPTLEDVREYFDADAVWVLGPDRVPRAVARARQVFDDPVVHPPLGDDGPIQRHDVGTDVTVVTVQTGDVLEDAQSVLFEVLADGKSTALVCDDVTVTVRPTALETTLEYASSLATLASAVGRETAGALTVLTGGLPATYDETWYLDPSSGACLEVGGDLGAKPAASTVLGDQEREPDQNRDRERVSVRVRGLGSVDGYGPARSISCLDLESVRDGGVAVDGDREDRDWEVTEKSAPLEIAVETLDADAFGLEAVTGIGPKTADRLVSRGIETRSALLETPVETLASLPGIGSTSAERMCAHASVLETGRPRRVTDESVPGVHREEPPLCLDIETDGLSPTILWQIGVYDPADDVHRAFVERTDPSDPGPVLERFCDWLVGIHPDRALCTWNGWRFDYRHLGAFVNRHVPHYADEWESVPKYDLYHWAVTDGNAFLPGRTNGLEDVSRALGYDGIETGLDGAATAAAYERFMRTGTELEWDRHEAYCEDDCRALWLVYERLRDAPVVSIERSNRRSRADSTAGPDRDTVEQSDATERSNHPGTDERAHDSSEQVGLDAF